MRTSVRLSAIALMAVGIACQDEPRSLVTAPPQTGGANPVLSLTASDQATRVDATITVTARAAPAPSAKAVGSFAGHLRYDAAGLTFLGESQLSTGMRAFNPQPGHIRVAGAAAEGFRDGRLFAVTFKVKDPRALAMLELALDELNGTDVGNRLPTNPHERRVHLTFTRP